MYGKIFSSLFTGSMVGAGSTAFAVMSFVIANQRPDKEVGFQVELNAKLLSTVFGESVEEVQSAIDYLCSPDPDTTTEGDEGRRLVKVGTFSYRVVNGVHYANIKNEEDRREKNRLRQQKFREKHAEEIKKKKVKIKVNPMVGVEAADRALKNGSTQEEADRIYDTLQAEHESNKEEFDNLP